MPLTTRRIHALAATVALTTLLCVGGCTGGRLEAPAASTSAAVESGAPFPDDDAAGSWPAWGGPDAQFGVDGVTLADDWPPEGPPVLWNRPLGSGYSAIVADRGALVTMYRDGDDEVTIALRADDGAAIWRHAVAGPAREGHAVQFGIGPHAAPLIVDDRVITLGYTGNLTCFDLGSGRVLWSTQLLDELGGEVLMFGYSASPILHDGNVVVLVGGERYGAVALDPVDGSIVWSGPPTSVSYATPIVIDVDGQSQLVYFSADEIIGLDAGTGRRLWSHPCVNQYRNNATGPIWGSDGLLWVATQLDGGARVLRLARTETGTSVDEVWFNNRISIHFWNALRLDDHVYASIGSQASVLAAVDVSSGEIVSRQRGFTQANMVRVGSRAILLDADGRLALVEPRPGGVEVLGETELGQGPTWTVPTLVGTTLYLRDATRIMAIDLG